MVKWDRDFSCFLSSVWYFNLHISQKFWIGRPRPPRYLFSIIICLLWMFVSFLCRTLSDWRAWPNFLQTICRPPGMVTNSINYSFKENINHQSMNCNILHHIIFTSCGEMLWWSNETEMPNASSHQFGISVCTTCKSKVSKSPIPFNKGKQIKFLQWPYLHGSLVLTTLKVICVLLERVRLLGTVPASDGEFETRLAARILGVRLFIPEIRK